MKSTTRSGWRCSTHFQVWFCLAGFSEWDFVMWLRTCLCFRWHLWRDWGEACWARWDPEEPVQLVRINYFPFFAENSPFFFLSVQIFSSPFFLWEFSLFLYFRPFSLLFRVFSVYLLNSVQLVRIHTLIPGLTFSSVAVEIRKRFFTACFQYLLCNGRQWQTMNCCRGWGKWPDAVNGTPTFSPKCVFWNTQSRFEHI